MPSLLNLEFSTVYRRVATENIYVVQLATSDDRVIMVEFDEEFRKPIVNYLALGASWSDYGYSNSDLTYHSYDLDLVRAAIKAVIEAEIEEHLDEMLR